MTNNKMEKKYMVATVRTSTEMRDIAYATAAGKEYAATIGEIVKEQAYLPGVHTAQFIVSGRPDANGKRWTSLKAYSGAGAPAVLAGEELL